MKIIPLNIVFKHKFVFMILCIFVLFYYDYVRSLSFSICIHSFVLVFFLFISSCSVHSLVVIIIADKSMSTLHIAAHTKISFAHTTNIKLFCVRCFPAIDFILHRFSNDIQTEFAASMFKTSICRFTGFC